MNQQRLEMERRLPQASPLLCHFLWNKLNEAGVRLPQEDIVLVAKLFGEYVTNTKEGKQTVMKMLGATQKPATIKDLFFPVGRRGPGQEIKPQDLVHYSGWIYRGVTGIGEHQIEKVDGGNLEACESTGILGPKEYCIKQVIVHGQGGKEHLTNLSNYARLHSEDAKVRDTASAKVCTECPSQGCDYHPVRNQQSKQYQQMSLIPLRSTASG